LKENRPSAAPDDTRRSLIARFEGRRAMGWRGLAQEIDHAIASVVQNGHCWAAWLPQVVALATPLVVPHHPIPVLNMSTTGDAEVSEVISRLCEALLILGQKLREAICHL
jgi:hypothetical protein